MHKDTHMNGTGLYVVKVHCLFFADLAGYCLNDCLNDWKVWFGQTYSVACDICGVPIIYFASGLICGDFNRQLNVEFLGLLNSASIHCELHCICDSIIIGIW
jgi:hypothetical protein